MLIYVRRAALSAFAGLFMFASMSPALAGTTGAIQGVVRDPGGVPLGGVRVTAVAPSAARSTVTAQNGYYAINGLPVDTYRVTFARTAYETATINGVTVAQDQNVRVDERLTSEVKTLGKISVRGAASLVQPSTTADTYTINRSTIENINGTPQDPNGFQALNALPGITTDNGGYPIVRAGEANDVGYEYEGVDNTDVVTGQFLNGLSMNGVRSIQLSTGGYDVSNGNTNSGVINQVLQRGAYPGSGQATIRVFTPVFGHELSFDYGNATPSNRFSYFLSFGGQRDGAGYGDNRSFFPLILGYTDFSVTDDDVVNLYYHFGKENSDELQFLTDITAAYIGFGQNVNRNESPYATNNGNVQLGSEVTDANGNALLDANGNPFFLSDYTTLYPGQAGLRQNIGFVDNQVFNTGIEKLNFKRQLSSSSFAEVRLFKTFENLNFRYPYNAGSFTDLYSDLQTTGSGLGFDYNNQLSSKHEVGIGSDYTFYTSLNYGGTPSLEPFYEPLEATGCSQVSGLSVMDVNGNNLGSLNGGCYIAPLNAALNPTLVANGLTPLATDAAHAPMRSYASDYYYTDDPVHRFNFYIKDLYQPNDRFTVDAGLRFDQQIYELPSDIAQQDMTYFLDANGNYATIPGAAIGTDVTRPAQISPRLALTYKAGARDVLRFSFGKNIEFEPEQGVQGSYRVDPALANCTVANGCFQPLAGYPGHVIGPDGLVDPSLAATNNINNLYQQIIVDQNTNNFLQYAPVRPERAVNFDFSIEHDFGRGLELKVSPYYRKGTDYVVYSAPLLFTLASGKPVFGASRATNAGINSNTGVEFDLQRQAALGLSGFLNFTYDNTLANYDSDFFPTVNDAAVAAGHFFHVSYLAPITGTLNLDYSWRNGFHASLTVPYESGYRYGVGKKTFIFDPNTNQPVQVLNTDLASTPSQAYYFTDPNDPGTIQSPNIIGSRGTSEGDDPGTLHGLPVATVNLTISKEFGKPNRSLMAGVRVMNLLGNYTASTCVVPPCVANNQYYVNNGFGAYGPGSGSNTNFGLEPYQSNYGPLPYENEPFGQPRVFTFFVSKKY
ncbi:MAG: TonB-dependent receptor [Candidatus Eremiobacteraeota bacterium]|nr:TonB-dependent receptor [Candidatus Eremiobacteraeota bacterium]